MRRSRSAETLPFDPEIERTLHQLRRENRINQGVQMGDNQIQNAAWALWDYTIPTVAGPAILRPAIPANNFELKPSLIQMVQTNQFGGYPNEGPDEHITVFL